MTAEVTIIPFKHPVRISFPQQSDYENNKARIKRIIKIKHKLNKFVFSTGEWFNENDTEKSVVVKRFADEKGNTNALLFKGSQQLVEDVKALLNSLQIKYEEKEVVEKEEPEQELPKQEVPPHPIVLKAPTTELTPDEFLKMHKDAEDHAFKDYAMRRITAYNVEINGKVRIGLLDKAQADKMKHEISSKMDIFIQKWSEAGDKWLKEKYAELHVKKEHEPEEDYVDLSEKPKEVETIKVKKKARSTCSYISPSHGHTKYTNNFMQV
jgi:hypothetical protein